MAENNSITTLMKNHHAMLVALLTDMKSKLDKNEDAVESFNKFKKELTKHFNVEEGTIFRFINQVDENLVNTAMTLMEEHKTMLNIISAFENSLNNKMPIDTTDFQNIHNRHISMEETSFYPRLDIVLSDGEKNAIYKQIGLLYNVKYDTTQQ